MPVPYRPTTTRPEDFDAYWNCTMKALDATPMAPEEELMPIRSTAYSTTYGVRFTSVGPYRLFGYLSIPHGEGPFPTLVYLTRLQSVVEPLPQGDAVEKLGQFLVFAMAARGQRNADRPYAASFPGLFMDGIEDPAGYVMRGIVADCCRAVDYVLTRPEADHRRMVGIGQNEMPLLAAALRGGLTHLVASPSFYYGTLDRAAGTESYPLEEVNEYLRQFPDRRAMVARTVSYFDPLFFAPRITVPTLLWGSRPVLGAMVESMPGRAEVRASEHSRYRDGVFQERWVARQLGLKDVILPAHWR
ncbi:MAG: acetylxylan esterase [Candidatus Latescibacteria bacterium]|nr:acetylxylan esterase [Candidatus Latescibacterota bacterium]